MVDARKERNSHRGVSHYCVTICGPFWAIPFLLSIWNNNCDEHFRNSISLVLIDHPDCPVLYKILVSVLNRPILHKQFSKCCHYFLLVCDSKCENPSGHLFHLREICDSLYGEHTTVF